MLRQTDMHKLDTMYVGGCLRHDNDTYDDMHSDTLSFIQEVGMHIREMRVDGFRRAILFNHLRRSPRRGRYLPFGHSKLLKSFLSP